MSAFFRPTTSPRHPLLGQFYSFTGTNPTDRGGMGGVTGSSFTPWQASIDRAPAQAGHSLPELALGLGNFTQSPAYVAANLPPYNSRTRRRRFRPSLPQTSALSGWEIALGAAALLTLGFFVVRSR